MSIKPYQDTTQDKTYNGNDVSCRDLVVWRNATIPFTGITPGAANQFLQTNPLGTAVQWATFPNNSFAGPNNSVLRTDNLGNVSWSDSPQVENLNTLTLLSSQGNAVFTGDADFLSSLSANGDPGSAGEILQKDALNNLVYAPLDVTQSITPGANDTVLITDGLGAVAWSATVNATNITADNLTSNLVFSSLGTSSFTGNADFLSNISIAGDAGSANEVLSKTSLNNLQWQQPPNQRVLTHHAVLAQDINAGAGINVVWQGVPSFDTNSGDITIVAPSNNLFNVGVPGNYKITVIMCTDLSASTVRVNLRINAAVQQSAELGPTSQNCTISNYYTLAGGDNIDVTTLRIGADASVKNTYTPNSSIIMFERIV